ncbi:FadR family transcriptional regulator [Steroidobacter sp. S1-65]|uniref:FadR family transcriptional regulator n=1 Tax=Steroidobacter gossypii TaxID=2805490 RepID=A0ABS1WXV1_9GAMM|nr:FadR/GntR family transcriptional regulator [Steroidobacter gossypii]MBM0105762.1 FadR family transcriptional regulator [Steroidobacter gossypii]
MRRPSGQNLTYAIVEELGHAVVTQAYGDAVPFPIEAELCKQFGASRTVLREAVKMLTAKGLLSARPRQGTWVEPEKNWNLLDPDVLRWLLERKFSLDLLAEFTEVRFAIEPSAAALAARSATPEGLARIHRAIERMKLASQGEDDPLESDIAFHVAVLHATGNRFYAQLEDVINAALRISIRLTNSVKGVPQADVALHKKVLDAIEAGDAKKARSIMEDIVTEVLDLIQTARRKNNKAAASRGATTAAPRAASGSRNGSARRRAS